MTARDDDSGSLRDIMAAAMAASLKALPDPPCGPRARACKTCGDGYDVPDAAMYDPWFEPMPYCAPCLAERRVQKAIAGFLRSVPTSYAWASLDAPELAKRVRGLAAAKAQAPAILGAERVVFIGPTGAGKTSLAVALLRWLLPELGGDGLFVHAFRLADAKSKQRLGEESPTITAATCCRVLLLDDLGNEPKTELSAIPSVVFERHAEAAQTWVTTPFGPEEIARRYGDGVSRRIYERALVIRLGGS